MTQQSALELQGDLKSHPFAELLVEISQAQLSGSLRLSSEEKKAIVYFEEGQFAFAVSNERQFRLGEIFAVQGTPAGATIGQPNGMSDLQWTDKLVESGRLTKEQAEEALRMQCKSIATSLLEWDEGEWTFSPLARLRSGVFFGIDASAMLLEYARELPTTAATARFRIDNEGFSHLSELDLTMELRPQEAFVLSRLERSQISLRDVVALSGLPESATLHTIYSLWLGGFLRRHNWNPAFTEYKIQAVRTANLARKSEPVVQSTAPVNRPASKPVEDTTPEPETTFIEITVDEYLHRVEKAESLYEVLGVLNTAKAGMIRQAYFNLAKRFHPDRFHKAEPELRLRIERAFTGIAQAHETLRGADSRKHYDIKLEQEQKDREMVRAAVAAGEEASRPVQESQASGDFERGFALQLRGDFEAALPYLARAVYYSPRNARYRAFYGKTLSYDEDQKHKAEHEIQAAIRLEPENPTYRVMLAEFFIRVKLLKRAEGELKRLLAQFPENKEARGLLDSLQPK
jgi:curved DNA-binding protein CbpA